MELERIAVTAADLRGPVEHAEGVWYGSLVEIEGTRWHVVSYTRKPTGMVDIAFKETDGARRVLHRHDVLPQSKFIVLHERPAEGV